VWVSSLLLLLLLYFFVLYWCAPDVRWQAKIEKTLTHIYQSIDLFPLPLYRISIARCWQVPMPNQVLLGRLPLTLHH
jgi:hypothetical protein